MHETRMFTASAGATPVTDPVIGRNTPIHNRGEKRHE